MTDLTFYTNPQSRGQTVRWMLEEVGQPYETKVIGYGPEMKSEPYLSVNPMGKVPAIFHRGKVVTEVAAICCYLADAFPEAGLAPIRPTAPTITAGSSSLPARLRPPSATALPGGSPRPSARPCSATATTRLPSPRWRRA